MRQRLPDKRLVEVYALFAVSFLSGSKTAIKTDISHMVILSLVDEFRTAVQFLGTEKLLYMLSPEMEKRIIKIGRDQLYDLLRFYELLIRRWKHSLRTTDYHP